MWILILFYKRFEDPFQNTQWRKKNKCNQCDFASPHEGGNLWRYLKNELNGNTKYEYAKSYSNHDGIVEILSVKINSENRDKNDEDDDGNDDDEYNNAGN